MYSGKSDGTGMVKPRRESTMVDKQTNIRADLLMDGDDNDDK